MIVSRRMPARLAVVAAATVTLAVAVVALTGERPVMRPRESPPDVAARAAQLEQTLRALEAMGSRSTWEQQWRAAQWIAGRFAEAGLDTTVETYAHAGRSWPNVVARISGTPGSDGLVVVSSHLDSIAHGSGTSPGADDNGSGVAVAIQVARDLADARPGRTVAFVVFSNEERGALGSRSFARAARAGGLAIEAVVNIDIVGFNRPSSVGLLDAVTAQASIRHKVKAAGRAVRNLAVGWQEPGDNVVVAGRLANRDLAERVSGAMRSVRGLSVRVLADDGCG